MERFCNGRIAFRYQTIRDIADEALMGLPINKKHSALLKYPDRFGVSSVEIVNVSIFLFFQRIIIKFIP